MNKHGRLLVLGFAFAVALSACSGEPEAPAAGTAMSAQAITIAGNLFYRERIALPPGAVAVAELEIADSGTVIAEARETLADRSVPVAITLGVDRAGLPQDAGVVFRGSIEVDGMRQWQSEPVPVDLTSAEVDLGRVLLRAVPAIDDTLDGTWVVEDIMGGGIIDDSRVTLVFTDGRIGGQASCNSYTGTYSPEDGKLSIGDTGVTMMACPEAVMNQERRFLDALASVDGYRFDDTGALFLTSGGSDVMRAYRED